MTYWPGVTCNLLAGKAAERFRLTGWLAVPGICVIPGISVSPLPGISA